MGEGRRVLLLVLCLCVLFKCITIMYTVTIFINGPFLVFYLVLISNTNDPFEKKHPLLHESTQSLCKQQDFQPRGINYSWVQWAVEGWSHSATRPPQALHLPLGPHAEKAESNALWQNKGRGLRGKDAIK